MNLNITRTAERSQFLTTLALAVRGEEWRKHIKPLLEDNRLRYEELRSSEFGPYYRARLYATTAHAMLLTHENDTREIIVDVVVAPEGDLELFEVANFIIFLIRYRAPNHIQLWFRPVNPLRDGYFVLVSINTLKAIIRDLFNCQEVRDMLS